MNTRLVAGSNVTFPKPVMNTPNVAVPLPPMNVVTVG
jgi:hypothetical protein